MITHKDIISRVGPVVLSEKINVPRGHIYQWRNNDSIPSAYWRDIIAAELATESELIDAAALKRQVA